jgi:hypothetical protein
MSDNRWTRGNDIKLQRRGKMSISIGGTPVVLLALTLPEAKALFELIPTSAPFATANQHQMHLNCISLRLEAIMKKAKEPPEAEGLT